MTTWTQRSRYSALPPRHLRDATTNSSIVGLLDVRIGLLRFVSRTGPPSSRFAVPVSACAPRRAGDCPGALSTSKDDPVAPPGRRGSSLLSAEEFFAKHATPPTRSRRWPPPRNHR